MKRLTAIILAITMVLVVYAHADAKLCDVEIKFRDLEWGCNIDEAVDNIYEEGMWNTDIEEDQDVHYLVYSVSVDKSAFQYAPIPDNMFVAGHLVSQVCVEAMYGIVDGKVSKEPVNSKLYKGTYYFETTENTQEIYDDLVGKLSGLYGEPIVNNETYSDYSLMWCGQNDSAAVIHFNDGEYPSLRLEYWDLGCYDDIVEMQKVAYVSDIDSIDGL